MQQVLPPQRSAIRIKLTDVGKRFFDNTGSSTTETPKTSEFIFACSNCAFGFSKIDLFLLSWEHVKNGEWGYGEWVISGSNFLKKNSLKSEDSCLGKRGNSVWRPRLFPTWPSDHGVFCRTTFCSSLSGLTTLKEARAASGHTLGHAAVAWDYSQFSKRLSVEKKPHFSVHFCNLKVNLRTRQIHISPERYHLFLISFRVSFSIRFRLFLAG